MSITIECKKVIGFTLVELLVVIAIIGIVLSISIPALEMFKTGKALECAAKKVQSAFDKARSLAITKASRHRMVFVKDGVKIYSNKDGYVGNTVKLPKHLKFELKFTDDSVPDDAPQPPLPNDKKIEFRPDGSIEFGSKYEDIPGIDFEADNKTKDWLLSHSDVIISQENTPKKCFMNIKSLTGRIKYRIKK